MDSQETRTEAANFPGTWKKSRKKPGQTKDKGEPTPMCEDLNEMVKGQTPKPTTDDPGNVPLLAGTEEKSTQDAGTNLTESSRIPQEKEEDAADDRIYTEAESFLGDLQGSNESFTRGTLETGANLLDRLEIRVGDLAGKADPYMVQQSRIALAVLQGARKLKIKGKTLFETYIKCMSKSKFYNLVLIGKHPEAHSYAYLGMERLLALLKLAKRTGIAFVDLLQSHNLLFNPEGQEPLAAFKLRVDQAIAAARASQRGEGSDEQAVEKFHQSASKFEAAISRIIESNGLVQQVDRERVASLKSKILELESSISA